MIKPIAFIVGAAVVWVASCLLLRKDNKTNEHNERKKKSKNQMIPASWRARIKSAIAKISSGDNLLLGCC